MNNEYKPTCEWVDGRESALDTIREERRKQYEKWGVRKDMDEGLLLKILVEEVGEVARAMLEGDKAEIKKELIQVGAVAAMYIQMMEAGEA